MLWDQSAIFAISIGYVCDLARDSGKNKNKSAHGSALNWKATFYSSPWSFDTASAELGSPGRAFQRLVWRNQILSQQE